MKVNSYCSFQVSVYTLESIYNINLSNQSNLGLAVGNRNDMIRASLDSPELFYSRPIILFLIFLFVWYLEFLKYEIN